MLAEGIVERPSDIDLCYVHGIGFPAAKGGPMYWADSIGLDRIHDAIVALYHKQHDDNWAPAPLLGELARSGPPLRRSQCRGSHGVSMDTLRKLL